MNKINLKILGELESKRIVQFTISDDKKKMLVIERCDMCFETELTKQEATDMVAELVALISTME